VFLSICSNRLLQLLRCQIGEYVYCSKETALRAVGAATKAYQEGVWPKSKKKPFRNYLKNKNLFVGKRKYILIRVYFFRTTIVTPRQRIERVAQFADGLKAKRKEIAEIIMWEICKNTVRIVKLF
jgi:hypothetical protein